MIHSPRSPLAALAALAVLTTSLVGVAFVGAQSASAATPTVWADSFTYYNPDLGCTQTRPCNIEDAVAAVNAAGGGTVEVNGDPNTPYSDFRADFSVPATIEASPGATPVFRGFGIAPVVSHDASLTVRGLDIYGGSFGILGGTSLTLVNSYVHDNSDAGVRENGPTVIRNSTIAHNQGYGVLGFSSVQVVASTISTNGSDGIFGNPTQVISSTLVGNGRNLSTGTPTIGGSIIAGSSPDCSVSQYGDGSPTTVDLGGNISDDDSCGFSAATSVKSSTTILASLKTLDFNGGTPTIGLSAGSPAIGLVPGSASSSAGPLCAKPDQRGLPRPSAACDAGAYQTGDTMAVTMTGPTVTITYGDEIPYFVPADPTGTRLRTAASCTTTADYNAPPGTYPVTCDGAVGSSDVTFSYLPGTLTITKATLPVTPSTTTMAQGGPVPTITPDYDYNYFFNGDTPADIDTPPTCTTTATPTSAVGTYPSSCTGGEDDRYTFTFTHGTVEVTDQTPPDTTLLSGPSGTITSSTATFVFSSTDPTAHFYCALAGGQHNGGYTNCSSPETYTGLVDSSYTFAVAAVDPAGNTDPNAPSRTFTVDTVKPQSISWAQQGPYSYGQAPVALTATASSGLPVSYSVASGDPCSVTAGPPATLAISGIGTCHVTATQGGNNAYTAAAPVEQDIVIAPLGVSVTVTGSQTYGGANLTWSGTTTGVGGVSLPVTGVSCSRVVVAGSSVAISASLGVKPGGYAVDPSSCVATIGSANYAVSGFTGMFTVTPFSVTVTAVAAPAQYGQIPVVTPSYSSFALGQTSSVVTTSPVCKASSAITSTTAPGTYPNTASCTGAAAANYTFSYIQGTVVITKANTTVGSMSVKSGLGTVTYSATLTRSWDGLPLSGQTITFATGGRTACTAVTNATGKASCSVIGLLLILGPPPNFTASYSGNIDYNPSVGTAKL